MKKDKITAYRNYLEFTKDLTVYYDICRRRCEYINSFFGKSLKISCIAYTLFIFLCIASDLMFTGNVGTSFITALAAMLPAALEFVSNFLKKPVLYGINSAMYIATGILSAVHSALPIPIVLIYLSAMALIDIKCASLCCELKELKKLDGYPHFNQRLALIPDSYVADFYTPIKERKSEMENLGQPAEYKHTPPRNSPLPLDMNTPLLKTTSELSDNSLCSKPIPLPTAKEFYHTYGKEFSQQYQIFDKPSEGE